MNCTFIKFSPYFDRVPLTFWALVITITCSILFKLSFFNQFINEADSMQLSRKYVLPKMESNFPSQRNALHNSQLNQKWIDWMYQMSGLEYEGFRRIMGTGLLVHYFLSFLHRSKTRGKSQ